MNKTILIIPVLFLLLMSTASAVPPLTTIFAGDTGLNIEDPVLPYFKAGDLIFTSIHVFNQTNGVLMNDVSCEFIVMGLNGSILSEGFLVNTGNSYTGNYSTNNKIGLYSYTIFCNNSNQGGYASGFFELTADGNSPNFDGYRIVGMSLGIVMLMFFFIYFAFKLESSHFILKLINIFYALLMSLILPSVFISLETAKEQLVVYITRYFWLFVIYIFVYFFWFWAKDLPLLVKLQDSFGMKRNKNK